ncbi:GNAT family N-acetyltransferase [Steroidobacter cummioxidans]|uniref:GNAT family N-acetyltransferase n=1 Tax=Steroidobacter cummioxidans TaxID=1803913 RepID=UPI00137B0394|nr:GNAT family N-acetyltransferase [Steroidobacter cummioxidans]
MSVLENRLVSRQLSEQDYLLEIETTGRGWVVERDGNIVAFAIGNAANASIWALFVEPGQERQGYGRQLHKVMVAWLWEHGHDRLWLTTESGTRASRFYEAAGWRLAGTSADGELRYELRRPE